jgi:hypothetical protein
MMQCLPIGPAAGGIDAEIRMKNIRFKINVPLIHPCGIPFGV